MRETLPRGGHHIFDILVARRLQAFYGRIATRRPDAVAIVDAGCGPGRLAAALAEAHPHGHVTGIDLDPVQIRIASRHKAPNLAFREGASHDMPWPDGSLDWVLATETFHHWSQPEASLVEIHRVLRQGGEFWIIEGAGDMSKEELAAWTGRRPFPGLTFWVQQIFKRHGYMPDALQRDVVERARASPFGGCTVEREDGWWVVRLVKSG